MKVFNFPNYLIKLIHSFLKERSFQVKVDDFITSPVLIPAGTPQGSCLSPTLFNLFISDFPNLEHTETAQYADDIAIWHSHNRASSITHKLQNSTNTLVRYTKNWKLKFNSSKTEAIFFTKRRHDRAMPKTKIIVENHQIDWSNSVKYLGFQLDQKLTFKQQINNTIQKSGKVVHALYSILGRSSKLHEKNKLLLYKVVLRPIFLYGSPVWGNCAKTHIKKLQIIQNRYLKMCLKLPRRFSTDTLHNMTNTEMIVPYIAKLNQKFTERCLLNNNPLILNLQAP